MELQKQTKVSEVDVENILPVFDRARKISMSIGVIFALLLDALVFTKVLPYEKTDFASSYFFSVAAIGIGIVSIAFTIKVQMVKVLGHLGSKGPTTIKEITKDSYFSLYILSHAFECIFVFLCAVITYIFIMCFSFPIIFAIFPAR